MIVDVIEDISYRNLVENQIYELIEYLINKNVEFSVTSNIKGVEFTPQIPETIYQNFPKFTMFSLMNYTYETLELHEEYITFEAGFGEENFGSVVKMPLYTIFQVIVDESILFINPTATVDKYFIEKPVVKQQDSETLDQKTRSMNAFKLNNKNKDLF
jgi:hypothetical protein